jgi:non-ribosomal peptide synthetase component F
MEGGSKAYHIPALYHLEGALDEQALERALQAVVARHESLRTAFVVVEGELRQKVLSPQECSFTLSAQRLRAHLSTQLLESAQLLPELPQALVEELEWLGAQQANQEFDLTRPPLLRAHLLQAGFQQHYLLLTQHHIVSDGWSMQVLVRDLISLYNAFRQGQPNPLTPLPIHYKDYARWQLDQLQGETSGKLKSYWQEQFRGELPLLELMTDYPRPSVRTFRGDSLVFKLDESLTADLHATCKEQDATLFMLFLTTVKVLLYRYTGQKDLIVGSPVSGRNHDDLQDQIGYFLNVLAIRTQLGEAERFDALLAKVKQTVLDAYDHQDYPFSMLVNDLNIHHNPGRSPLFDVSVVMQNHQFYHEENQEADKLSVEQVPIKSGDSKSDVSFEFYDAGNEIYVNIGYSTDLFRPDTIEKMKTDLLLLLQVLIREADFLLDDIAFSITEEEENDIDEVVRAMLQA